MHRYSVRLVVLLFVRAIVRFFVAVGVVPVRVFVIEVISVVNHNLGSTILAKREFHGLTMVLYHLNYCGDTYLPDRLLLLSPHSSQSDCGLPYSISQRAHISIMLSQTILNGFPIIFLCYFLSKLSAFHNANSSVFTTSDSFHRCEFLCLRPNLRIAESPFPGNPTTLRLFRIGLAHSSNLITTFPFSPLCRITPWDASSPFSLFESSISIRSVPSSLVV